jgi:hypothetical protein
MWYQFLALCAQIFRRISLFNCMNTLFSKMVISSFFFALKKKITKPEIEEQGSLGILLEGAQYL